MKQVTINIPENMYSFFMELVQKLGLEKVENETVEVPDWQKTEVIRRMESTSPEEYLTWEEIESQLENGL
jgi:hypothetical protein